MIAVLNYDTSSPTGRSMRIVGHDASLGTAADKQPVTLSVDDGSVPNLLFTVSEKLVAWDMTTWDIAWSSNVAVDTTAVPRGGRLFTRRSDGKLLTLDAATGATLSETPLAASSGSSAFTDGPWARPRPWAPRSPCSSRRTTARSPTSCSPSTASCARGT